MSTETREKQTGLWQWSNHADTNTYVHETTEKHMVLGLLRWCVQMLTLYTSKEPLRESTINSSQKQSNDPVKWGMLFWYGCVNRKQVIFQSSPYANTNLNATHLVFRYTLGQFERIMWVTQAPNACQSSSFCRFQLWLAEADLSVFMTITHLQPQWSALALPKGSLRGTEACDGGWCVLQVTWPVSSFTHRSLRIKLLRAEKKRTESKSQQDILSESGFIWYVRYRNLNCVRQIHKSRDLPIIHTVWTGVNKLPLWISVP